MNMTQNSWGIGVHNSKAFSILNTLQKFGFVQKDPVTKTYSLGMGLIFLSQKVLETLDLREVASPFLSRLSSGTNSTAFLGLISGNYVYVMAKDEGSQTVAVTFRIGQRFPLFLGHSRQGYTGIFAGRRAQANFGRAMAFLFVVTECRSTYMIWRENLSRAERSGFAVDLDETKIGIRSVAAPVFGPTAKLIGAFVVIGTFPGELADDYGRRVANEARIFSQSLEGLLQSNKREPSVEQQ